MCSVTEETIHIPANALNGRISKTCLVPVQKPLTDSAHPLAWIIHSLLSRV